MTYRERLWRKKFYAPHRCFNCEIERGRDYMSLSPDSREIGWTRNRDLGLMIPSPDCDNQERNERD